jgi:hypothetical protein
MALVGFNVVLSPRWKSVTGFPLRILDASRGIDSDVIVFHSPFEHPTHGIKEVSGLCWSRGATFQTVIDDGGVDPDEWFVPRRL